MSNSSPSPSRTGPPTNGPRLKLSAGMLFFAAIVLGYAIIQSVAPPDSSRPPSESTPTNETGEASPSSESLGEAESATSDEPSESFALPVDRPSAVVDDRSSSPKNLGQANKTKAPIASAKVTAPKTIVKGVTIRDQSGRIAYQGDVDLTSTLQRIDRGQRLSFPNDGSVFRNRERRLPNRQQGYYREWVHPTPKLSGPGPQRVVTGQQGEAFYTHDHYATFKKIR